MDSKRRERRVICKHCHVSFSLPDDFEVGGEKRAQVQCPRKQCGEWGWYERHELGLEKSV